MPIRMRTSFTITILALTACAFLAREAIATGATETHRHVVVVVWDGMRPDFVTRENTPTLWKLARGGVVFRNHHSTFLSATNVNGTAIATGLYPNHNGIFANFTYQPQIDATKCIDMATLPAVRKGDEISGG